MEITSRVQSITARMPSFSLKSSFRRTSSRPTSSISGYSACSDAGTEDVRPSTHRASSPARAINDVVSRHRQSMLELFEDERRELDILEPTVLEPKPTTYFCTMETRMASF